MRKYKIGYTSGVYDMFHIGHLNILKRAKEQCDVLVVGVSTDSLVESYKFKKPVISFEDRSAIVGAIRYVDKVVPQINMDKLASVLSVGAEVVFVGDDWKGTEKWNAIELILHDNGVDLVYLPHTDGVSSTILSAVKEEKIEE